MKGSNLTSDMNCAPGDFWYSFLPMIYRAKCWEQLQSDLLGLWTFWQAVVRHVDWAIVRCLVVAGPGFTKEQFKAYMEAEAVRQNFRWVFQPQAVDMHLHTLAPQHPAC